MGPACVCSVISNSPATPWTTARQAPLSMGFSKQEYWSGLPFPSPGDHPDAGTEPVSPVSIALQVDSLPLSLGSPMSHSKHQQQPLDQGIVIKTSGCTGNHECLSWTDVSSI